MEARFQNITKRKKRIRIRKKERRQLGIMVVTTTTKYSDLLNVQNVHCAILNTSEKCIILCERYRRCPATM